MTFTVHGKTGQHGDGTVTLSKETRWDAVATALRLLQQGFPDVSITDGNRTYTAPEFVLTLENE